jgi:hypothetical protein
MRRMLQAPDNVLLPAVQGAGQLTHKEAYP